MAESLSTDSPLIIGEVRDGARSIVEQLLAPHLRTLLLFSAASLRCKDEARARGDAASEALYEAEADYFTTALLDLLGILGQHVPGPYGDAHRLLKEGIETHRGSVQ